MILVLAAVYVGAGWLGLRMDAVSQFATLVWAPTGIGLAAIVRLGYRAWPGVWLGALSVNVLVGAPVAMACGIATGNTLEAVLGAALLFRIPGFTPALARVKDALGLVILAAMVSTTASATIGTLSLHVSDRLTASFAATWRTWWMGDLIGDLVVAPVLLTLPSRGQLPPLLRHAIEAAVLGLLLCSDAIYVFFGGGLLDHSGSFQKPFLASPLLIWAALRFGVRGASWATFLMTLLALWGTAEAYHPLHGETLHQVLDNLQAFTAVTAATFVVLGAAASERSLALLQERLARREATQAQEKLALLADAGVVLSSSLEFQAMAEGLAQLIVARIGKACGCTLDLLGNDGQLHRYAECAVSPEKTHLLHEIGRLAPRPGSTNPAQQAFETGNSVLIPQVDASVLDDLADSAEQRELLEQLALCSLMIVPLVAQGRVLGLLTVPSMQPERRYDESDLAFLQQLAQRAAVLFNHALQYKTVEDSLRAQEDTLAMIAHDLRNPLGAIRLSAQLLEGFAPANPERIRQTAASIRTASDRMGHLLGELLEVSFLNAGAMQLATAPVSASALVRECVRLFLPVAQEKQVTLVATPLPSDLFVAADRERLSQVLDNLVGNALKFVSRGGRVTLSIAAADGRIVFSIADTGPGIPEDILPRLFARYWTADQVKGRGIGLGLHIAKGIVEAHGGRIWVDSAVGVGTTFHFTVPAAQGPAPLRSGQKGSIGNLPG